MIHLSGYQILSKIYESTNSKVYRAIHECDYQKVILKVLKEDYPTPSELTRYKQEYELTKSLDFDGIIKAYNLEKYQNTLVIILEDFNGESLKTLINNRCFILTEFLKIAIKIVNSLVQIHSVNIIHKDINPANIIFNPQTEELKIIDFGISTRLTRENPTLKNPYILEGTLSYISPEQTGRMNRSLDYRTDFYFLGVTLYELLTRKLPFETDDYLELIYYHIAKNPLLPREINPLIPQVISDIVMKLMAKNAEDRYQSAWGLKKDLETCLQQLELTGNINYFPLAIQDISDKFQISQKLYGRGKELKILLHSFEKVTNDFLNLPSTEAKGEDQILFNSPLKVGNNQGEMILITGYSGIGKSALVQEIYKPLTENQGYFISGKFDQFQRNIPYSAIVNAFQELVKQLLTENDDILNTWKIKLLEALGVNASIMIEVIPELELIIGKQLPMTTLGVNENQNRFNLVFQKFINTCCSKNHPLVIFLDDLQWADQATLNLIELIINDPNLEYLLLIGAYRNHEVKIGHPLLIMLENLNKNKIIINQITLDNLSLENVKELIADTFKTNLYQIESLAELVYHKTLGNPFFTKQFLHTLYLENLIYFDYTQQIWQWDILKISTQNITANVVELMINELKMLPESTQLILQLASCLGSNFDLETLSIIEGKLPDKIFEDLIIAINSGLILALSELDEDLLIQSYQFLHDRVQQGAYELISEGEKVKIHLKIGQLLLQNFSEIEREEYIFDLVQHLNKGRELIPELRDKENLARLNLLAGIKAKNASAYAEAKTYLDIGINLLRVNSWETQYDLTLNLYIARMEVAYLHSNFQEMEELAQLVLENAQTIFDKVKIYEIQIALKTSQSQLLEAIAVGREVLQQLGIELPTEPDPTQLHLILQSIKTQIGEREIAELIDLPLMSDRSSQIAIRILAILTRPVFMGMPTLLPILSSLIVSLSLEFGNTPASTVGYGMYGMVLCAFFGEVKMGYDFGKLAINLEEKLNLPELKSIIPLLFGTFIQHRQEALKNTLLTLKTAYLIGMDTGSFLDAGYGLTNYIYTKFFSGFELGNLAQEIEIYSPVIAKIKQLSSLTYLDITKQTILNLIKTVEEPDLLLGINYDERVMISQHYNNQDLTAIAQLYIYKLILAYTFNHYQNALNYLNLAQSALMAVSGMSFIPILHFYGALTYLALDSIDPPLEKGENGDQPLTEKEILKEVENHQNIVYQWAKTAPMNCLHKCHLIEAEKQRILGNKTEAIEHYDLAIKLAQENEFINDQALALELTAKFYFDWEKEKLANIYLEEAYYHYTLWGATAKVKFLEQQYPQLLTFNKPNTFTQRNLTPNNSTSSDSGASLDLTTVMKISQAIAREIILGNLLQTLIEIIIQNVGAQKGCFLLSKAPESPQLENFYIYICSQNNLSQPVILINSETDLTVPKSILNYVIRTGESVNLDPIIGEGIFANDPYIQFAKPLSVLCYPFFHQGQLIGIVYLENNLISGTFTNNRIEFLQLLSGQVAIAITNAQLYAKVKEKEQQLQQFLEAMPVGIAILDAQGRPYYANQKAQNLLGKGVDPTIKGEEIAEVYQCYLANSNEIYPNEKLPIIRALGGFVSSVDDIEINQGDRIIPVEAWGTPIYNSLGVIEYAMAAFQDISQRKQAEKILFDYNQILEKQVKERTIELQQLNQELSRQANLDGLTQIANRRRFDYYLLREWQRHLREKQPLALILIDIDYFKRYNDQYGHQGGDDCLIKVAQTIALILKRPTDLVARYGGEEFAVILPNTKSEGALMVAQEIKQAIAILKIPHLQSGVSEYVTLSLGVASLIPHHNLKLEDLISQADQALYKAKNQGRNQVKQ